MKIEGTVITRNNVVVDVHAETMLYALLEAGLTRLGRPAGAQYVNKHGIWESWTARHGSGDTETYGPATEEQRAFIDAMSVVANGVGAPPLRLHG